MMYRFCIGILAWLPLWGVAQIDPQRVTIARDTWGVPHIFAATDAEVAYGLAWAHAEDDFKTIQLPLLAGKQMLGRHLGADGAAADYVAGLIRVRAVVEAHYDELSPAFVAVMEGYVQGLNDYARAHPKEVLVSQAFPVTVKEALRGALFSIAVFSGVDGAIRDILSGKIETIPDFQPGGSNTFAFSRTKTTDGKTYLNINSHQPLEGPVAWYEAHLCSEEGWNILGALFPGGATAFLGVNEHLGWAHTVNNHDKMDVYELAIHPRHKNQYRYDGEWRELEVNRIPLKIKRLPFKIYKKALACEYGPVIRGKNGTFALRFAAMYEIKATEQWYRMNKARTFSEFYDAMHMTAIPGFNTVYADRQDTLFYISNGKIPLRNPAFDWQQTLPGDTSATRWTAFHPVEDLPQVLDPPCGYVYNTNNSPYRATGDPDNVVAAEMDPTMGIETYANNRSIRFETLVAQYPKLGYEDFKRIKYDLRLPDSLAYPLDVNALFSLNPAQYPDIRPVIEKIQHWDHNTNADNPDAAVFMLFYNHIRSEAYQKGAVRGQVLTADVCAEGLRHVQKHLIKYFGTVDVTLGEVQKLVRGDQVLPAYGVGDVIAAMYSEPYKKGLYRVQQGESYISLVRFPAEGLPEIETINCYGASNHPESPHYADQMPLYLSQRTKPMTLDKTAVLAQARRIYHPGE